MHIGNAKTNLQCPLPGIHARCDDLVREGFHVVLDTFMSLFVIHPWTGGRTFDASRTTLCLGQLKGASHKKWKVTIGKVDDAVDHDDNPISFTQQGNTHLVVRCFTRQLKGSCCNRRFTGIQPFHWRWYIHQNATPFLTQLVMATARKHGSLHRSSKTLMLS
jgi:hypothetical protein